MLTTMSFSVGAPARLQVEARRRFKGTMLNTKRRPIKVRAPRRRRERPGSPQRLRANAAWRSALSASPLPWGPDWRRQRCGVAAPCPGRARCRAAARGCAREGRCVQP
jgi:hypothetical protein